MQKAGSHGSRMPWAIRSLLLAVTQAERTGAPFLDQAVSPPLWSSARQCPQAHLLFLLL